LVVLIYSGLDWSRDDNAVLDLPKLKFELRHFFSSETRLLVPL
jgi:hypothetical protein